MSVIRELAAFVRSASAAALPDAERALLRRHVADTLVAAVAGARTTEACCGIAESGSHSVWPLRTGQKATTPCSSFGAPLVSLTFRPLASTILHVRLLWLVPSAYQ